MSAPTNPFSSRLVELDILRGAAIVLVLGRHVEFIPEQAPLLIKCLFLFWRRVGWIGVDLFFVLSGFLVSGLLFVEYKQLGHVRLGRFLMRRGLKIYPAYYVFLITSFFTAWFLQIPSEFNLSSYIREVLFIQNYSSFVWAHTWSLAVEEHFYFILALVVFVLLKINKSKLDPFQFLPIIFGVIAVQLLVMRVMIGNQVPIGNWWITLKYTHLRIDSLLFGVLLSYLYNFHRDYLQFYVSRCNAAVVLWTLLACMLATVCPLESSKVMYTYGFTILYMSFGGLVIVFVLDKSLWKQRMIRLFSPLGYIGQKSYSIYLWHVMVYMLSVLIVRPQDYFLIQIWLYLVGSILIGIILANLIELPVLRIRDRYFT